MLNELIAFFLIVIRRLFWKIEPTGQRDNQMESGKPD